MDDPVYSEPGIEHSCTIPDVTEPPNLIHTIAYINIDNEINNHCIASPLPWQLNDIDGEKSRNCYHYDQEDGNLGKQYAESATQWVYDFREIMDDIYDRVDLPPTFTPILLTVGMSTEVYEESVFDGNRYYSDPELSVSEFHVPYAIEIKDENGNTRFESRSLADIIDFPSPHRYSPDATTPNDPNNEHAIITIRNTLRRGPTQPLMMEEYGAPTDPRMKRPITYQDGFLDEEGTLPPGIDAQYCRFSGTVLSPECKDTAPGLIQRVINDMRSEGFAGYSAFMLADVQENSQGDCEDLPFDIFTGLYATGRGDPDNGCGGTINNRPGALKNTGYRVCVLYQGRDKCYAVYLPLIMKR